VAFTKLSETEQILCVGDKTGDVIAFPVTDITQKSRVLLGHTASIITALAMADEGKLLISADRDEKIRVSRFPQTSSIYSYCLGHSEFISCLAVSKCSPVVFSGSGDGTIVAWNYHTGEKEASFDSKQLLRQGNETVAAAAAGSEDSSEKGETDEKEAPSSIVLVDERTTGSGESVIAVTMQKQADAGLLKYTRATKEFKLVRQIQLPAGTASSSSMVVPLDAEHQLVCMLLPAPHFMTCVRWNKATFDIACESEVDAKEGRIVAALNSAFSGEWFMSSSPFVEFAVAN
jgi:WD40 repeat protein